MHFCKRDKSNYKKQKQNTHTQKAYTVNLEVEDSGDRGTIILIFPSGKKTKKNCSNFNRVRPRINKNTQIQYYPRIMNRYCLDLY